LIRLAVRCRPERAERILAELVELAPGGVEEERGDGYVELAIYGPPGELPEIPALEAAAGEGLVEIATTEVPDDWAERWRDFHRPTSIAGGRITVRPSWHEPRRPPPGTRAGAEEAAGFDVVIDPGRAFGTGAHPTTALCLEILLELADAGEARGSLADLGTGSGVLAIGAARLGWDPVIGVDSEAAALEAARANAEANGVALDLRRANLRREAVPAAGTVVANLTGPVLLEVAERMAEPPRAFVCSGLLETEAGRVEEAFGRIGLRVGGRRVSGDWAALCLHRDSDAPEG
jgi:ribosomal protein L11 methyltransferase